MRKLHNKYLSMNWLMWLEINYIHLSNNKPGAQVQQFIFTSLILTFSTISALANSDFFECTLPQAEEYRVGIDIQKNIAGFFDNDTTSIMKFRAQRPSVSSPGSTVLIFTGKDSGGDGDLRLEFNVARNRVKLSTVESDGTIELLGFASCAAAAPWDWSPEDLAIQ